MIAPFICMAIALHDVDGPIRCQDGTRIRLAGIGAREIDGTCRPQQPCPKGDPIKARRAMAAAIGATIARETTQPDGGQIWFARPIRLRCEAVGVSYGRVVAWCRIASGADLSCTAIRLSLAARWDRYWQAGRCR